MSTDFLKLIMLVIDKIVYQFRKKKIVNYFSWE